jgi:sulfotransferase family protein
MISSLISTFAKKSVLHALNRMMESTAVQDLLNGTFRRPRRGQAHLSSVDLHSAIPPYTELGTYDLNGRTSLRDDAIFITARFRSGSTLLWNLFRHIDGMTAYYEPFNERRWFDPAVRGDKIDTTHKHVADYWREYEGLEILSQYYRLEWISKDLLMDSEVWEPKMQRYVELLMERASGRPIFQFNRIDFRLPWFRHHFPNAKIIHLYRHPREQWCSTLMDVTSYSKDAGMSEFAAQDKFYLCSWAHDLKYHFPFLDESIITHGYQLFYFLWKLSYLFGVKYSDCSLSYESLLDEPDKHLTHLFSAVGIESYDIDFLRSLIVEPSKTKWKAYADDNWFRGHETICETIMAEYFGKRPITAASSGNAWCLNYGGAPPLRGSSIVHRGS